MSSERDAYLLAALRHAPDHDAVPPPEVTRRILAAARDAAGSAPSASAWQRLGTWWLRPQVGAAFATLAVATLLGVMWSTHEPPLPASAPTVADRASAPGAAAAPPPPAVSAPAVQVAKPAAAPVERQAAKAERRRAPAAETRAQGVAETLPTPEAPAVPAEPLAKAADAVAPTPPPAPAAAPAPMRARTERAVANELGSLAAGRAEAPAAVSSAYKAQAVDPLQALEAAGGTSAWTWRASGVDGGRAHGEPQRALWTAMRLALQGRWEPVAPQMPPAPWLVLRHGSQSATFWLMDGALHVTDAQRRSWRAPVSAEQARDWQQAVGSW